MKRATSADVARLSGVSRATVSYVLNDVPGHRIPDATRERILAAAAELDYVPSASAAALKRGRTNLVLLDTSGFDGSHKMTVFLSSFAATVRDGGFTLLTHSTTTSPLSVSEMASMVSPFAVASLVPFTDGDIENLRRLGIQQFDGADLQPDAELKSLMLTQGASMQVDVLAQAGHRALCFAQPSSTHVDVVTAARHREVRARAAALGIAVIGELAADGELPALARQVRAVHEGGATAVVAANDETAIAVLAGARVAGLTVPRDLAVIGFDDIPLARFAFPALTTVRLDSALIARVLATDLLIAAGCDLARVTTTDDDLIEIVHRDSV
ncbi:LacI family DNA-binding transcriptional regulator [Kutzneria sp. NPDC052558]|uniref:LacI family DNA-binding transcriptional regulator n=1 Tax=Kutzneria sp. NPDC052558 TaxID=3364121 RepID=UPI0037C8F3A6